jgi:hypothetical protein
VTTNGEQLVVTEQRGKRFVAPGFVALACVLAVGRVVFGGSRNTATIVAAILMSVVGLACLAFCIYLALQGRSRVVVTRDEIRLEGAGRGEPPRIDRSHGDHLILHIAPSAFSHQGGQQYTREMVTPDGAQRVNLMHFDPKAVASAAQSAGWTVTEGNVARYPQR